MKKMFLTTLVAMIVSLSASAAEDWISQLIKLKSEYASASIGGSGLSSDILKHKSGSSKINVDLSGYSYITLVVTDAGDGTAYDQMVWGDGVFTTTSGEKIPFIEMPFESITCSGAQPRRGKNYKNQTPAINGAEYDEGVVMHANTNIIIKLDKGYKSFTSLVGIDDGGGTEESSVKVNIIRDSPEIAFAKFVSENLDASRFMSYSGCTAGQWLSNNDGSLEQKAIEKLAQQLDDPINFINEMKLVDGDAALRTRKYLYIYKRLIEIVEMQEALAIIDISSIKLAHASMSKMAGYDVAGNAAKITEMENIMRKGLINICYYDATLLAMARRVLELKQEILLSNPALDVDRILATRHELGQSARNASARDLGTESNNWSNILSTPRTGKNPASIVELNSIEKNPTVKTIFKAEGILPISHLRMHWDADRVMFSTINDRGLWGVFEVPLAGGEKQELVSTPEDPDLEFFDATYLPNGKIAAISNIGYQGVPCVHGSDPVGNLVLYNPEDKSLRRTTFDQDANWNPIIMNNGKMMYVRWEYADLTHYFSRIVMHMNPDGTEQKALYGSGKFFPNSVFDVYPLPGQGSRFVGIVSGHHGVDRSGRLMIFDPAKGRTSVDGMVQEIPHKDRIIQPLIRDHLVDDVWPQFVKPFPISDEYFLVSAKLNPKGLWGIYLVDIYDNMTLIKECEGEGFNAPILVEKRSTPPAIPEKVDLKSTESSVFIQDIYEGVGLPEVPRGTIKELRLFSYEYAYIQSPSNNEAQGVQSGWDIKRLLGKVKVEADGSATFKIPANTPISIQPLDSLGRAVQWMRSWITGMPGEVVSCVGCHEDQNSLPRPKRTIASTKAPTAITPPEGGPHPVSFNTEIQPMLDRACISCHNENSGINLTGGRIDKKTGYNMSYLAFHPYVSRQGSEADAIVMTPYEYYANTSEIVQILRRGHHGVELTEQEWSDLYTWIDMNAPDKGAFVQNDLNGYDQIKRRMELAAKYNDIQVDWQQESEDYLAYVKAKNIQPEMPVKPVAPNYKKAKASGWPFNAEKAKKMQGDENRKVIEIAPGVEMAFVRIPAGSFVMGSNSAGFDMAPETKVTIEKSFWISETEVTNGQYVTIDPTHDSRIIAQMWKDHTNAGYVANRPGQPVIRISWQEAMAYCKELGEKLGMKMNLPTEAQWEWAAAAGSGTEHWFGDRTTDFSKYANMADAQLQKMAVAGVDPQPMAEDNYWFKYYNFLLREPKVNDGQMIVTEAGVWYEANPWGLHDVHGNVSEWTRSDYKPYPYVETACDASTEKVARGGSWIDRPKNATLYTRKPYLPWQKVNNVGFRIIIED